MAALGQNDRRLATPEDSSVGDTITRTIGPVGGEAFKKCFHAPTVHPFDARRVRLNDLYADIVQWGAEAISRYDREIAHTSDAMAVATALALKYNHISQGLGRVAWLTKEVERSGPQLFSGR